MRLSYPQQEIINSQKQINLFLSGVGSGKTFLQGVISYQFIQKYPELRGFIGANTFDQLNTSTVFRIREVWSSFGVNEYNEKTKQGYYVVNKQPPPQWNIKTNFISYNNIITFINGFTGFLGSLDNAKAHEGKEFAWALLDETKDTKEQDVKDIILARLRQLGMKNDKGEDWNPLFIGTTPAKVDWINQWFGLDKHITEIYERIYDPDDFFRLETDNKLCVIASTYHNQANLPENYITNKKTDWTNEKFKTLIYANPFSQTGGEYISSFDRLNHVGKTKYNPDLPLHISFDFNSVPYSPLGVFQIEETEGEYNFFAIDEIALKNPNNSTEAVCEWFVSKYKDHKAGLFIYGDATGRNSNSLVKEYRHHVQIIESKLKSMITNYTMRIPFTNAKNIERRDFMNRICEGKLPINFIIGEQCNFIIQDFTYCKQDSITGLKDKHRVKDSDTGETYEKYGHFLDLTEYLCVSAFESYFQSE